MAPNGQTNFGETRSSLSRQVRVVWRAFGPATTMADEQFGSPSRYSAFSSPERSSIDTTSYKETISSYSPSMTTRDTSTAVNSFPSVRTDVEPMSVAHSAQRSASSERARPERSSPTRSVQSSRHSTPSRSASPMTRRQRLMQKALHKRYPHKKEYAPTQDTVPPPQTYQEDTTLMNNEQTDTTLPDMVDTSLESNESPPKADTSVNSEEIDMQQLVREIRAVANEEKEDEPRIIRPTASCDTVGKPVPPRLQSVAQPPTTLPKPIPRKRDDEAPPEELNDEDTRRQGKAVPRAMTPMMRMRSPKTQETLIMSEEEMQMTAEEIQVERQKRWKKKLKEGKELERRKLEEVVHKGRKRRHKKRKDDDASEDGAAMQCQTGIANLLDRFTFGKCGDLFDALEPSDEEMSMYSEEMSDEEDEEEAFSDANDVADTPPLTRRSPDAPESLPEPKTTRASFTKLYSPRRVKQLLCHENSPQVKKTVKTWESDVDIKDRNFIKIFINGITENGATLLLHKQQRKDTFFQPSTLVVYLRRGREDSTGRYQSPYLEWVAEDGLRAGGVDLFDIRSLERANALQLENYPLAMPGRSLFIRLNSGADFVFEASTEESASRFIHGLRWVIARLSLNLIIGNLRSSCDLLDISREEQTQGQSKTAPSPSEAEFMMAMNDVSNRMIDSTIITISQ